MPLLASGAASTGSRTRCARPSSPRSPAPRPVVPAVTPGCWPVPRPGRPAPPRGERQRFMGEVEAAGRSSRPANGPTRRQLIPSLGQSGRREFHSKRAPGAASVTMTLPRAPGRSRPRWRVRAGATPGRSRASSRRAKRSKTRSRWSAGSRTVVAHRQLHHTVMVADSNATVERAWRAALSPGCAPPGGAARYPGHRRR